MAKFIVHKQNNFTVLPNSLLKNKNLSLKALGLLCKMLSLPEDWDYSFNGLCALCKEGDAAMRNIINELKDNGYLVIRKLNPDETEDGRYAYEYSVYEEPFSEDDDGAPETQEQVDTRTRKQGPCNRGIETGSYINNTHKEQIQDRASPATPAKTGQSSGKLFSTRPTSRRKTSVQKTNAFITMCERVIGKKDFDEVTRQALMDYFRMLGSTNTLLPEQAITEQLNYLLKVRPADRPTVVRETISHGWKSLQYVAKDYLEGSTPSWDTAKPDAFRAKTMEEKRKNPLEGVSEDDIF